MHVLRTNIICKKQQGNYFFLYICAIIVPQIETNKAQK